MCCIPKFAKNFPLRLNQIYWISNENYQHEQIVVYSDEVEV